MNYTTSKDYEELWRLVQDGKEIVCFTHGLSTYVSIAMKQGKYVAVFSRGVGDIETNSEIDFIQTCKKLNLEFLPPDAWIKIESDKDLPREYGKYLLRCEYGTEAGIFNHGVFSSQITDVTLSGVTHWKPMPEAPEVQS